MYSIRKAYVFWHQRSYSVTPLKSYKVQTTDRVWESHRILSLMLTGEVLKLHPEHEQPFQNDYHCG